MLLFHQLNACEKAVENLFNKALTIKAQDSHRLKFTAL
jgi:hypothetical protein